MDLVWGSPINANFAHMYAHVYVNTDRKILPLPLQESKKSVSSHNIKDFKRNRKLPGTFNIDTYTTLNNYISSPQTKIQCPICAFQMPCYNIGTVHALILLSNRISQKGFITGFPIKVPQLGNSTGFYYYKYNKVKL